VLRGPNWAHDSDASLVGGLLGRLEQRELAFAARHAGGEPAKLADEALPAFQSHSLLAVGVGVWILDQTA
jgi:hypothetical protein